VTPRSAWTSWAVSLPDLARGLSHSPTILPWLESARAPGWAHGSQLVELVAGTYPGEAVRGADELLAYWHQIGLVRPAGGPSPTPSQLFLGHGGRLRVTSGTEPPSWFAWRLVGPIWLRGSG
jgi:hypothetical protein